MNWIHWLLFFNVRFTNISSRVRQSARETVQRSGQILGLCGRVQVYSHFVYLSIWNRIRISPYCTKFYWILHKSSRVFFFFHIENRSNCLKIYGEICRFVAPFRTRGYVFFILSLWLLLQLWAEEGCRCAPREYQFSFGDTHSDDMDRWPAINAIFNLAIFGFSQSGRLSWCSRGASICFHF